MPDIRWAPAAAGGRGGTAAPREADGISESRSVPARRRERGAHGRPPRRVWRGSRRRWLLALLIALGAGFAAYRTQAPRPAPAARAPARPATPPAAAPPAAYLHPVAALTAFRTLPEIGAGVLGRQLSSVDPAGRNRDGSPANVLYKTPDGASVIFAATGPGVVNDIWVAGSLKAMGDIRITIDGRTRPAVDMPASRFFAGRTAPFLAPLVGNAGVSSGGDYAYVPIAFRKSCVIAFTGTTAYWHVGFYRLPPGSAVRPFSPSADLAPAAGVWSRAGRDPYGTAGTRLSSGRAQLAPGGTRTLARITGPGRIQALEITVPSAAVTQPAPVTRSGLAFTGASSFTLRIDPNNRGVRLVRRFDYAVPDQTAKVFVNGSLAGSFTAPGRTRGPYLWRDAAVTLPARLTAGHDRIRVTVTAAHPFTAFTYRAYSLVGGAHRLSDTLRLNAAGERAHAFSAAHVLWRRRLTATRTPAALAASRKLLDQLRLQVRFDGAAKPQVDAPLGLFFGAGLGAASVHALMLAVDPATGALTSFWPMPFARSATVRLVNRGATAVGVRYRIRFLPRPADAAALAAGTEGYFHATYERATPTPPGHDDLLLAAGGTGRLVGVSLAMSTPPGMPYGLENLQGNVRIYTDGNPTPAYLGTGTEDFFQGGWYFEHGPFSLPTHGSPDQWVGPRYAAHISAYRLFLSDAIPFHDGIRAGIQVGPTGNLSADYRSVADWYGLPAPSLVQTDALQPADAASAAAHGYRMVHGTRTGPVTAVYPGQSKGERVTAAGTASAGATFTVAVSPQNAGVLLRARVDQCPGHQAARVYVDGTAIGRWSDPASNCSERWKDVSFLLPAAATRGHTRLHIRLVAVPGPDAGGGPPVWRAFGYQVLSFVPVRG